MKKFTVWVKYMKNICRSWVPYLPSLKIHVNPSPRLLGIKSPLLQRNIRHSPAKFIRILFINSTLRKYKNIELISNYSHLSSLCLWKNHTVLSIIIQTYIANCWKSNKSKFHVAFDPKYVYFTRIYNIERELRDIVGRKPLADKLPRIQFPPD